ncbi:unnamed protein product, partial [Bubo scandiacus]
NIASMIALLFHPYFQHNTSVLCAIVHLFFTMEYMLFFCLTFAILLLNTRLFFHSFLHLYITTTSNYTRISFSYASNFNKMLTFFFSPLLYPFFFFFFFFMRPPFTFA